MIIDFTAARNKRLGDELAALIHFLIAKRSK